MAKKDNSSLLFLGFVVIVALVIGGILVFSPSNSSNGSGSQSSQTSTVKSDPALIERSDAPTIGSKDAKVKIVVFSDFLCPYCQQLHTKINSMLDANSGKVSETIRTFTVHPQSDVMARAGEAANIQGKFKEAADAIFSQKYQATEDDMVKMAGDLGFDVNKFKTDLNSSDIVAKIKKDNDDAAALGLGGTPSVFVNDKYVDDLNNLDSLVSDALK